MQSKNVFLDCNNYLNNFYFLFSIFRFLDCPTLSQTFFKKKKKKKENKKKGAQTFQLILLFFHPKAFYKCFYPENNF